MPLKPLTKSSKSLPPVLNEGEWESSGIMQDRPANCRSCRFSYKSVGFTPTWVGADPKIGIVFPHPDSEEVVAQVALQSVRGAHFLRENIEPLGYTKDNLIVSYVLRCLPPWDSKLRQRDYPTGSMRYNAEQVCRRYDSLKGQEGTQVTGGIVQWQPDMFVFTFDPADKIKIPAYTRLIQRAFAKAKYFADHGYKPVVLLGAEAIDIQAPWVKSHGGVKAHAGGYVEQGWRSHTDKPNDAKLSFR